MQKQFDVRTAAALVVTLVLWASAFAGIRAALESYSPGHLALLRFLTASAVLGVYALISRMRLPALKDLPGIILLGLIGITVYHTALNYGEVTVTAGAASLLIGAGPVFTAILATVFTSEKLTPWGWTGILVSFGGIALIALGEGGGIRLEPGAGLVLLSALATGIYIVFQKPFHATYSALEFTTYSIWAGTAFMLIFLPGLPAAIQSAPLKDTVAVIYLGIFPAAAAYASWNYTLTRIPASIASSLLYITPVLSLLIAWVWLGEFPTALTLAGGAIAIVGVVLVGTRGRQKRAGA